MDPLQDEGDQLHGVADDDEDQSGEDGERAADGVAESEDQVSEEGEAESDLEQ